MTRRLIAAHDTWDEVDGEPQIVGHAIAWEEDGKLYKIEHNGRTFDLEQLEAPSPIPPEHLTAPWVDSYLEAPNPLPPNTFLKSNPVINYEPSYPTLLTDLTRREIETYMRLIRSPHPNICPFYGCVRDGRLVTALALKLIPHKFPYIWKDTNAPVPKLNVLRSLKRGLGHLHNLGIVHNDINRTNVRLDENLEPVIIDFNTALPEGASLTSGGTPGWAKASEFSLRENDLFGLGMFAKWLDGYDPDPFEDLSSMEPWTEDYLAPKILADATSSGICNDILARAFYSGAHLTMLNDDAQSNSIGIPEHLLNERIAFAPACLQEQFEQAWITACAGLRSDEVDVVFFSISSDIMSENGNERRRLRHLLFTLPQNLRHPRMQPRVVLADDNADFSSYQERRRLADVLNALTQDTLWTDGGEKPEDRAEPLDNPSSGIPELFSNFVLVQRGGWLSWNRLRLYLRQGAGATGYTFQQLPHLVAPNNLVDFVLEPPPASGEKAGTGSTYGSDPKIHVLFGICVSALSVAVVFIAHRFIWVSMV